MLQNAYLDVKIGVDTDENEPKEEWCVVADPRESRRADAVRREVQAEVLQRREAVEDHADLTAPEVHGWTGNAFSACFPDFYRRIVHEMFGKVSGKNT